MPCQRLAQMQCVLAVQHTCGYAWSGLPLCRGSSVYGEQTVHDLQKLGFEIVDFDLEQAIKVAELRPLTKHLGLSLGDRSCLALAMLRNTTAVTADRNWKKLSLCQVEVIR